VRPATEEAQKRIRKKIELKLAYLFFFSCSWVQSSNFKALVIFTSLVIGTVRDTEFRASFFCHFKKLRCKSLNVIILLFSVHVSRMSVIEVNNVKPILHFLTVY
jgi:hypothetical protein